jgi:phosphoribosylformylglycinamidine cyclo-ligase
MNGLQHEKLTITGQEIRAGDIIIALKQNGFRSNGISKVRSAFEKHYGPNYYTEAPRGELEQALAPSAVYARALSELNGWYSGGERQVNMTSVSHLSGGSFVSKFLESAMLPKGLSARLDTLFVIPEITRKCAMWLIE